MLSLKEGMGLALGNLRNGEECSYVKVDAVRQVLVS